MLDEAADRPGTDEATRRLAVRLGVAGLLPFAALAIWLAAIPADHVWRATTIALLCGYGAVTLSFLGGIRWGLAVTGHGSGPGTGHATGHDDDRRRDIAISVAPPLLGWAALLMPPYLAFVLLAVAFAAQGAWDALAGQTGILPLWFARLRMQLTLAVVVAMVVAFAATAAG